MYHNEQHLLFPHTCISQHNLCCDNCHSHVARALNLMRYNGSTSWNMYKLGFLVLLYGKYTGSANIQNVHVHIHVHVYYACIFTCTYVHACEFCVSAQAHSTFTSTMFMFMYYSRTCCSRGNIQSLISSSMGLGSNVIHMYVSVCCV